MAVGIRSQKYRDPMENKRRRRGWLKAVLWGVIVVSGGVGGAFEVRHLAQQVPQHLQKAAIAPTPRAPAGTWCRGDECQYFDRSGDRWGEALKSSGPLLLLVQDQRTDDTIDPQLIEGIFATLDGLSQVSVAAKSMTLPDAEPGGMTIATTRGYDIYVDALGDVPAQMAVLRVFLADRAKDPAFASQYIDLRTPGRVYYK